MNLNRFRARAAAVLLLPLVHVGAAAVAAQDTYDKRHLQAASTSRLNGLALPGGALRVTDAGVQADLAGQLARGAVRSGFVLGRSECLAWGGKTHSLGRGQNIQNALKQVLIKNGYRVETAAEERTETGRATFFVAGKPGANEALLGFFVADEKLLLLAWGQITPKKPGETGAPEPGKLPAAEQKRLDDALEAAVESGTADEVKTLLAQGARADRRTNDGEGQTLVQRAVVLRSGEKLALLLQAGGDPNGGSGDMLPLTTAALTGQSALVELLLDKGADVNAATPETGRTALHLAAITGEAEIVRLLLGRGADPARPDKSGKTPRQIAEALKQTAIAELLAEAEAKKD